MSNRDDFSPKVKTALAARAGYHCSFTGCGRTTLGPSEEAPDAVSNTGKAAHISGAAPGKGSRRYQAHMTPEERASIENGIWLCSTHADYIDRDEVTYTIETLQAMKRAHEAAQGIAQRDGKHPVMGTGLFGIGADVVCTGDVETVSATSWLLRLRHFVVGDVHRLITFIDRFAKLPAQDRYVLSIELGDGRVLSAAPSLTKLDGGYALLCPVEAGFPRVNVQNIGSTFALHPVTNDWYAKDGQLARVSGLEALPQSIRTSLSMQRGESLFRPDAGVRFFEYFEEFKGSPLLDKLLTLDVIRQASIPFPTHNPDKPATPLRCITRVRRFELLSETPTENHLPVRVDFEVQGHGVWQQEFSIYMPRKAQVAERAGIIAQRRL